MTISVLDSTGATQTIQTVDDLAKNAGATTATTARMAAASDSPEVVTLGAKTDAKNAATDATAVSAIALLKQLSAYLGGTLTIAGAITGTLAATQSGTWTVQPGNTQNTTAWRVQLFDGTTALPILAGGSGAPGTGVPAIAVSMRDALAAIGGANPIGGVTATNVAITEAPVNEGGQAVSAENTLVTAGRKVQWVGDLAGKQIILPYANPENFVNGPLTTAMTGTADTLVMAAPAAGLRNYVTSIVISNSHATVGTDVVLKDGSGGAVIGTYPAAAAYGGVCLALPTPLRQPTTATAIYAANLTTGASVKVTLGGYKGA